MQRNYTRCWTHRGTTDKHTLYNITMQPTVNRIINFTSNQSSPNSKKGVFSPVAREAIERKSHYLPAPTNDGTPFLVTRRITGRVAA